MKLHKYFQSFSSQAISAKSRCDGVVSLASSGKRFKQSLKDMAPVGCCGVCSCCEDVLEPAWLKTTLYDKLYDEA